MAGMAGPLTTENQHEPHTNGIGVIFEITQRYIFN